MFYSKEQDVEAPRDGSAKLSEWGKETQTEIKQIHYLEKYSCIYILLVCLIFPNGPNPGNSYLSSSGPGLVE